MAKKITRKKVSKKITSQKYVQYSKQLATAITIMWCFFRFGAMAVSVIQPSIALAMVDLLKGADDIMMVNIGFYSGNSVAEKVLVSYFDAKKACNDEEEDTEEVICEETSDG